MKHLLLHLPVLALLLSGESVCGADPCLPSAKRAKVDSDLQKKTGWKSVRKLSVSVELLVDGEYRPVPASRVFATGEQFRIRVTPDTDLYVYVLVHNADKTYDLLVPASSEDVPIVRGGKSQLIPPNDPPFEFQGEAGKETLRILGSVCPLPKIAPQMLFELESGAALTTVEEKQRRQLRQARTTHIAEIVKRQSKTRRVKGLNQATELIRSGAMARAIEVIAVEENEQAQTVTVASPEIETESVIVAEIVLTHRNPGQRP
jgi:hypothetical protein